ncbi:MAG: addiction module protein [bacterium]
MSPQADQVLLDALKLSPMERAELIEKLLASFPFPDRAAIDERWATEAEDRLDAFERGEIKSRPASEVFSRVQRGEIPEG